MSANRRPLAASRRPAVGIYIGDTDDAPGAALIGILLMIGAVVLGVRTARRTT